MKKFIFLVLMITAVCAFGHRAVFAQTGVSLEVEIKNIEASVSKQGISAVERHDALVRLARLRQLSGDIEGAAKNWFEAAAAIPGKVDNDALLSCAYCLAAMGEWDRAATALDPLLSKSPRARFLNTVINAIKTGDLSALGSLADNPEYSGLKVEILFVLWKLTQGDLSERWRQRLINEEFNQTPEGILAAGKSSAVIKPSPFWLFAGGLDSLPVLASEKPTETTAAQVTTPPQSASAAQSATAAQTATVTQATPPVSATVKLQTGIFGREANAQAQAAKLRQAGFSPSIEQRIVNGNEMWAVIVSAATDQKSAISELREAGFESFPVK
jgi:tetratricopeptide (TPR) repeat protein